MKKLLVYLLFLFVWMIFLDLQAIAQKKNTPAAEPAKSKAPKLRSFIGNLQSTTITLDGLLNFLKTPVTVKDEKGNDWEVSSMRFWWRTRDRFEDPETGQTKTNLNSLVKTLSSGRLPESLIESIMSEAKSGDVLIYELIIAKSTNGNQYLAPRLQFNIQ